jgi:hypothetical protein
VNADVLVATRAPVAAKRELPSSTIMVFTAQVLSKSSVSRSVRRSDQGRSVTGWLSSSSTSR